MRRACVSTVRSPRPHSNPCPGGGAQHRQPVARRPCLHEHPRNAGKDTPKLQSIYNNLM
ncbi:MAG: hypothetical protein NZ455_07890 [Bacteroidia bacterium]|nr:hypothetical protein [Bacteroidia bacterium]MDW8345680.1 hypothetical protein [Bacteroidia bacterium]